MGLSSSNFTLENDYSIHPIKYHVFDKIHMIYSSTYGYMHSKFINVIMSPTQPIVDILVPQT